MNYKAYKVLMMCIIILIGFFLIHPIVIAADAPKTILIVLNEFNLDLVKKLENNDSSIGLVNNRTVSTYENDGKVSKAMTLAMGRRVKSEDRLYNGVKSLDNGHLKIIGFEDILVNIRKNSDVFIDEKFLMGEYLKNHDIKTGYIGKGNTALLAADRNGIIEQGVRDIKYEKEWLLDNTKKLLDKSDVVVLEYESSNNTAREKLLLEYIEELKGTNFLILSFDLLSPMAFKSYQRSGGILTSNTTKRIGIVSNLDILPHIANIYGLDNNYYIGHEIKTISSVDSYATLMDNLLQSTNLNQIKYFLHGLIIIAELYFIFIWIIRNGIITFNQERTINSILLIIFTSFMLGFFKAYYDIILYLFILLTISIILSGKLSYRFRLCGLPFSYTLAVGIYLIIVYGIFLNQDFLYKSFMGYNNVLVGGRFYGLNNGIAGVFLASSVLVYHTLKTMLGTDTWKKWVPLVVLIINIIVLSGSYGANTGGYFTAIALFMLLFYDNYLKRGSRKQNVLLVVIIALGLLAINLYMDTKGASSSHAGELILRIKDFGIAELINAIGIKIKQLIFMTLLSPWVIILIGQIYFIKLNYKQIVEVKEAKMIFYIAVIGLIINDTGVIAFTYMNTFLIAILSSLHNTEKRDLC